MAELQQQLDISQQQNTLLQQQLDTLQPQNTLLQQQLNDSQQNQTNLQQQLDTLQPQNTLLQQEFNDLQQNQTNLQQQLDTLQPQNTLLQQQLNDSQQNQTNLQQQLDTLQPQNTLLQQQLNDLQQQLNVSQGVLSAAQFESASYKKQLDEMSEKYQKLSNTSGIENVRDLFKQLTSSQIDALHTHTNFRVDTFETVHGEQQVQCSSHFVQLILTRLKSSVDAVIQLQKNTLAQRKKAKGIVIETLTIAGVSKAIVNASIKPLETEIEHIEASTEGWNTFSAVLIGVVNQSISASLQHEESKAEAVASPEAL
jgi:chromosome segregation ATPase